MSGYKVVHFQNEVIEQAVITRAASRQAQNPPNTDQHTPQDDHISENDIT